MASDTMVINTENKITEEVSKAWRAWVTIHEMVRDRGYEVAENEVKISLDQFRGEYTDEFGNVNYFKLQFTARPSDAMLKKFTPSPTATNPNPEPDCGTIFVEFCPEDKIGIEVTKKFISYCKEKKYRTAIFVTLAPLSPQACSLITSLSTQSETHCELFLEDELLVNITHHELVPQHVLLSKAEKAELLRRYRLVEKQLPRILAKDPAARYLGMRRGQVVKIIRTSETAGRYASYRLCA